MGDPTPCIVALQLIEQINDYWFSTNAYSNQSQAIIRFFLFGETAIIRFNCFFESPNNSIAFSQYKNTFLFIILLLWKGIHSERNLYKCTEENGHNLELIETACSIRRNI